MVNLKTIKSRAEKGIQIPQQILERLGCTCGSTAVLLSAPLSIGCKIFALFSTDEQKLRWLPYLASHSLTAFCLSELDLRCDAGGQQTVGTPSADSAYFLLTAITNPKNRPGEVIKSNGAEKSYKSGRQPFLANEQPTPCARLARPMQQESLAGMEAANQVREHPASRLRKDGL